MFNQLKRRIHFVHSLGKSNSFYDEISEAIEAALKTRGAPSNVYKSRYNPRKQQHVYTYHPDIHVKRKKCCILLGYSGANYYGMQRNESMKTIEEELLKAMLNHKWITGETFQQPYKGHFQRASRTDRGVSAVRQCISLKLPKDVDIEAINNDLPPDIRIFDVKRVTQGFDAKDNCDARTYSYTLPTVSFADHGESVSMENYRLSDEKFEQLNILLKMFEGTKNFHNFTTRKEYFDPSANRFVASCACSAPFLDEMTNIEFAVIKMKGQSFMMHQIRKMIGLTLAVIRGLAESKTITQAFTSDFIDIPRAPGLGLVLDRLHYDRYNTKFGTDSLHETLDWISEEEKIQKFFGEHIFPTIVKTEMNENSMVNWLETLPKHSFEISKSRRLSHSSVEKSEDEKTSIQVM